MHFVGFFPASIFIFDVQLPRDKQAHYDFADSPLALTVAIRLGTVGIIAALQDGGAQKAIFRKYMERVQRLHLHPVQFLELTTRVFYQATLFNRIPKYMTIETEGKYLVHQLPLQGLSAKPIYDQGKPLEYARHLAIRTGYPVEELYEAPNKVRTFLEDTNGNLIKWSLNDDEMELRERVDIQRRLTSAVRGPFRG